MDEEKQTGKRFDEISEKKSERSKNKSGRRLSIGYEFGLRVFALVLSLAAAIILGVIRQTKIVSVKIIPTLPPVDVVSTAKATYLSAFVYAISANAISCSYTAVSIVVLMVNKRKCKFLTAVLLVGDLVTVALLFSSTGAAGAIGLMGFQGNKHVMWNKVCNVFGKFCHTLAASLALSFIASSVFLILVLFDATRLPHVA